jgi:hypothetical protein
VATGYIRRELGAGEVKFIVATIPGGTVAIPAGAALLFIYTASQVSPWLPAVIAVGVGGVLFYWLRIRIKQRAENSGSFFVASPTGLIFGDRTIPRAGIQKVIWTDRSRVSPFPDSVTRHWDSDVCVWTVSREPIILAIQMEAGIAERLASELGWALGDVQVSGGRARTDAGEI